MWQRQLEVIAASYDVSDTYTFTVDAHGNNYGLLFLAVDPDGVHYDLLTEISTYVQPVSHRTTTPPSTPQPQPSSKSNARRTTSRRSTTSSR
jgi:hypothetical protein